MEIKLALAALVAVLMITFAHGQGYPDPYTRGLRGNMPVPNGPPPRDPYREFHSWGGYDRGPTGFPDPRPQRRCIVPGPNGQQFAVPC